MKPLDGDRVGVSNQQWVAPGDHVCCVVDCAEQASDRVVAWVSDGLEAGERVVLVDRAGAPSHAQRLDASGIEWRAAVDDGRLVILPTHAAYLADGVFDVASRLAQHAAFIEQSVADGYPAVRVAVEATVALESFPDLESVLAYERGFEALSRRYPVSGICIYDRATFEADLPAIARAHPRGVADDNFGGRLDGDCIRLSGDIDISNVDLLAALLEGPPPAVPAVDIDVSGLSFIDVAGTGAVLAAAQRWAPAARTRLVGPSSHLRTVLTVGGWMDAVDLVDARS